MARLLGTLALIALAASGTPRASAQAHAVRIVLADDDPELRVALDAALAPWHVELVVLPGDPPGASMPSAAERGRRLAEERDAAAVAWTSRDDAGAFALWIFDRASGRVVARALPVGPPFDAPTAAEVALAIKTLLRHSAAAPASDRIASEPVPLPSELRLEMGGGVRTLSTSPADADPRALVGLSFWPRSLPGLGFALSVAAGTGLQLNLPLLRATLIDIDFFAGIRGRFALERWVDITLAFDIGITAANLSAHLTSDGSPVGSLDVDASGRVSGEVGFRPVPTLRIGLRVGLFLLTHTRTYFVRGTSVLDTQPLALDAAIVLEVPLDGASVDFR